MEQAQTQQNPAQPQMSQGGSPIEHLANVITALASHGVKKQTQDNIGTVTGQPPPSMGAPPQNPIMSFLHIIQMIGQNSAAGQMLGGGQQQPQQPAQGQPQQSAPQGQPAPAAKGKSGGTPFDALMSIFKIFG